MSHSTGGEIGLKSSAHTAIARLEAMAKEISPRDKDVMDRFIYIAQILSYRAYDEYLVGNKATTPLKQMKDMITALEGIKDNPCPCAHCATTKKELFEWGENVTKITDINQYKLLKAAKKLFPRAPNDGA